MGSYRLSKSADDDLARIATYTVEKFGVDQAIAYRDGLNRAFVFLAEFPLAARERSELRQRPRVHRYASHLIFYRVETDGVLILRVRHGREDWMTSDND